MDTAQISELLECLENWGKHFKRKQHPVTLTLLRAASVIREQLAAAGGTEGRCASSPPSCPGGDTCDDCGGKLHGPCYRCGAPTCCDQCCKKNTAETMLRRDVYGVIEYWQGVSECQCDSASPIGACLRCDMERLEDRTSELLGLISEFQHNA